MVWGCVAPFQNVIVGKVGNGFHGCAENEGGAVQPAMGRVIGKATNCGWWSANAVETIRDVHLDMLYGTMDRVSKDNMAKQVRQGVAKLHGVP
jgi:hypothetical protein